MTSMQRRWVPEKGATHHGRRGFLACVSPILLALVLVCVSSVRAAADVGGASQCSISQITSSTVGSYLSPAISGTGLRTVFRSFIEGSGPRPHGFFLFDERTGEQTTLIAGEAGFPPNLLVSIDDSGSRIAVASFQDLTGENPDGNQEIFLFDTAADTITQVTHTTEPNNLGPVISADGAHIVFRSMSDLTGENEDGSLELFLFDTKTSSFTQVTRTTTDVGPYAVNADGTRVAFVSDSDPTGQNADGNDEIFLLDTTTGAVTQITRTTGDGNVTVSLDDAGTRIAFSSDHDHTGQNPDGNIELFLFDTTTGTFAQITRTSTGHNYFPSFNGDGTRIAFNSGSDLTGENADGNDEIVLVDTTTGAFTQVTHTQQISAGGQQAAPDRAISKAGNRIAFLSRQDLTGSNPDHSSEVFVASCDLVNELVSLAALPATFRSRPDTTGCPAGFTGTFSFAGRLATQVSSPAISDIRLQVNTLTNGNVLQNADGGPAGLAATLTVPHSGDYADGLLGPGETVDVPMVICLKDRSAFQFFVDVLGDHQ